MFNNQPAIFLKNSTVNRNQLQLYVSVENGQKELKFLNQRRKYNNRVITENCWGGTEDKNAAKGFPGGAVVENVPANAGDTGSSPGLGRSHMPRSN